MLPRRRRSRSGGPRAWWGRPAGRLRAWFGRLPVVTRLVLAVAVTMSLVLTAAAGLVYWRVQTALDRQLHDDLATYRHSLDRAVRTGTAPPPGPSGSLYQVLDTHGRILASSTPMGRRALLTPAELDAAAHGRAVRRDVGSLLPITPAIATRPCGSSSPSSRSPPD